MGLKYISLCTPIIAFAFVIGQSDGLQCFNCQSAIPESGEDPCQQAVLETCPEASTRCLSAKFSVSATPLKNEEEVISAMTCFPEMNGHECEFFLKKVQQTTPSLFKVKYHEGCKVCSTDGCNSAPGKETLSAFLFIGAFLVAFTTSFQF